MIDVAIESFEQKEEALDRTNTTHDLAAVIPKRCPPIPQVLPGIVKIKRKPLSDVPIIDEFQG